MSKRQTRKKIVEFIEKYEIRWYVYSLIFLVLSVPASFLALPDTDTATFIVVSIAGILSAVASLASALVASNVDQEDPEDEVDSP